FERLGLAGGNWVRIWMIYWHLALEGTDANQGYHGAGVYNLVNAWKLDELFRIADRNGINLMLCLDSFNELRDGTGHPAWKSNPYARERGGPLATMRDFWTDREARRLYRQKLRYLVARWGAQPNLFAWEFWNEVDGISRYETNLVAPWHAEMGKELKPLDPYHHLVTTSGGGPRGDPAIWTLPEMDLVQAHAYNLADTAAALSKIVGALRHYGKPVIVGEFGAEVDEGKWIEEGGDQEGVHLATALWAVPLAEAAGTPMIWYWGNYVNRFGLWKHFAAVNRFLRGVDWPGEGFRPVDNARLSFQSPPPGGGYRALRIKPDLTEWGSRQGTVRVGVDGRLEPDHGVSQYLYGDGKPEFRSPLVIKGEFKDAATLRVHVLIVSDRAQLVVTADGTTVFERALVSGKGKGEWKQERFMQEWNVYQNFFDRTYEARIPPGTREIRIANTTGDWMTVGEFELDPGRAAARPPLDVYALAGTSRALVYLKHADLDWMRVSAGTAIIPCPPATLALPGLHAGDYRVEAANVANGDRGAATSATSDAGGVVVLAEEGTTF
ncbi:MAG: cellulase family glycosylhydrolase, partial [bacterium]